MEIRHFLLSVNNGNGKLIATETVSMQTNGRKSSPTRRLGFSVAGFVSCTFALNSAERFKNQTLQPLSY